MTNRIGHIQNLHTLTNVLQDIISDRDESNAKINSPPPATPVSQFDFEYNYSLFPQTFPEIENINLPVIREKGVKASIEELGEIFDCTDYKFNLIQFWFLDVIADCIWMAQDKYSFPEDIQKTILAWILFAFDLIRDPGRNLSRKEFLDVFRETVCVAAELIDEGCYDVPVPLKMVTINDDNDEDQEEASFQGEPSSSYSDSKMKDISEEPDGKILSCIEFHTESGPNVHVLKKERCVCSEDSKTSTTLTVGSSSVESCSQGTNDRVFSIHDFYRADTSTPPRFKSFVEVPKELSRTVQEDEEEEEEMGDKILIQLEEASSKESSEMITKAIHSIENFKIATFLNSGFNMVSERVKINRFVMINQKNRKKEKVYVVFRRPSFSSLSSEEKETRSESVASDKKSWKKVKEIVIEEERQTTPVEKKEKRFMDGLKLYKLWEKRIKDLGDSKIGLEPWQIEEEVLQEELSLGSETELDSDDDVVDEEILELLKNEDFSDLDEKEYLSFGVLWSIIDFVYSYFSDSFQYSLVKIALTAPPNIITQNLNEMWCAPKLLKDDMTKYVKDITDKYKRIPVKKKKEKAEKVKKEKPVKEKKEKMKKETKPKLTKEEKDALKVAEKLKKQMEKEEMMRKLLEEMNKKYLFPLQDAGLDDEFFKSKFKNFKKVKIKGKGTK